MISYETMRHHFCLRFQYPNLARQHGNFISIRVLDQKNTTKQAVLQKLVCMEILIVLAIFPSLASCLMSVLLLKPDCPS